MTEIRQLNKDNKNDGYAISKEFGIRVKNKISSALYTLGMKQLRETGLDMPTEWAVESWIEYHASHYDEAKLVILEKIIEPMTPNVPSVRKLFYTEKLDLTEEEIDAYCAGFLESPLYKTLRMTTDSQTKLNESSQSTGDKTEQPQATDSTSGDTSPQNTETS